MEVNLFLHFLCLEPKKTRAYNVRVRSLFKFKSINQLLLVVVEIQSERDKEHTNRSGQIISVREHMHRKGTQYKEINRFLSSFTILQHSQGSTILSSDDNTYLIRNIQISSSNQQQKQRELNEIIMTLSTHQSFNCKNILPLINFDIVFNKNKTQSQIRAIYYHGRRALWKEIEERRSQGERFDQDALWSLLYSLASPLAYLQQKSIVYGVLDTARVFLDNDVIAIMDPSSTGIDPYEIMPHRLYSPQLLSSHPHFDQLNMFKSDVFVLGLMMLQCSLLQLQLYDYDQTTLHMSLSKLKQLYSQGFCNLISSMVNFDPDERPSFDEILMHVNEIFQIAMSDLAVFEPAVPDQEDQANEICCMEADGERENVDILETEYVRFDDQQITSSAQIDKTDLRFYHSNHSQLSSSPINQSSEQSQNSSLFIQDSMVKSLSKTKRVNKPKQIKDKLIKNDYESFSTIGQNQTLRHDFSQSVINKNQVHRRAKTDYEPNLQNSTLNKKTGTFNQIKLRQSKENQSNSHNFSLGIQYSPLNKENLFTKPEIMNMIKHDMKKIQDKKKKFLNVNFSYVPENQEKEPRQIVKNSESHQKASQNQNQTRSFHQISLNSNRK